MTVEQIESPAETDEQLLRRFAATGDADAFGQLSQRYAGMVYATSLRVVGDAALAEDVSQEVFFRLLRRSHEINQSLPGWLHRTATHVALDALRSESARHRREWAYARDGEGDRDAWSWAELSPAIDQALADLPEGPRLLLVQHYLLGKPQAELARQAGQSPATICRRVQEALGELRARLRLKGVLALPAALAALLCHVAARPAPASLVRQLGKMKLFTGAASLDHATPRAAVSIKTVLLMALAAAGLTLALYAAMLALRPINGGKLLQGNHQPPCNWSIEGYNWSVTGVVATGKDG